MNTTTLACAVLLAAAGAHLAAAADAVVDDFEAAPRWTHHPDGGSRVAASLDTGHAKHGKAGLRLVYRDAPPHWGNVQGAVTVPAEATAVALWLRVHSAEPQAAMHLWLFEPDGDGWLSPLLPQGKTLAALGPGWHSVVVPIGSFRFQPRGNRRRQLLAAHKLLLGCNFAHFDVTIDHLRFLLTQESAVGTLATTPGLRIERGRNGALAILADDLPRTGGAADPARLATLARKLGYGVALLKAGDVADPAILKRANFDALIVPCAPAYPRKGRAALLAFLKAGGGLVSIGGYAFDSLLHKAPDGWSASDVTLTAKDMDKARPLPETINTRFGRPGDTLGLQPDQIGAFDPSYPLRHVAYAATAPGQHWLTDTLRVDGPLEGHAACAITGSNSPVFPDAHARWTPLLNATDSLGRLRGAALAVVHHWSGPFVGSHWALAGVTNRDLFAGPQQGRALLRAALGATVNPLFLHGAKTKLACYRQGEAVQASVRVANGAPADRHVLVQLEAQGGQPVERTATVPAGKTVTVTATLHDGRFDRDYYRVSARLLDAATRQPLDRIATAFVVWDAKTLRAGPAVAFQGNALTWNGAPRFLCGSNQTGMMWYSEHEDPLVWERDFAGMQANGLRMLRILHFSPFAADKPTEWRKLPLTELLKKRPQKLLRQTDAIVQLAQKHGVAICLTLHDWIPVELSDADLAAQRGWNRFWADRYKDVPGILYDVQNEPQVNLSSHPDITRLYNRWLEERYGTWDALCEAWGTQAPAGKPWTLAPRAGSDDWADVKTYDANLFRVRLLNRWVKANTEGVKAAAPHTLVNVGYLRAFWPADQVLGVEHTDFSNMHYHADVPSFAAKFKRIDRRFVGKGLSLGEFGAREAHDARTHGRDGTEDAASLSRFLTLTHYTFGLGGSFALNWCWKDFDDCVFPWGLIHPCDRVAKPVLHTFRNTALFLERLRPRYEDPGLAVLLPDSHRLGAKTREVHAAIFRTIDALLANHVNFNVANEFDLARLPATCKSLVWPVPYCPSDAAFERVLAFVQAGGTLYFSGDVAYDERRKRTRTSRLEKLGLKDIGDRHPFVHTSGRPMHSVQRATVGKGKVFYVPRPIELDGGPVADVLRDFLEYAGVKPISVEPKHPLLHVATLPLTDGEVTVVVNRTGSRQDVKLAGATLAVGPGLTGLVARTGDGQVVALECTGKATVDGKPLASGDAHVMIASEDGRGIRHSRRLVVYPITPGRIALHPAAAWKQPVLEAGEFDGPAWRSLQTTPLAASDGTLPIHITPALHRAILIVRD